MTATDMAYDIYKHLITLDTGAMVVSLISFLISIFGCLSMLVIISSIVGGSEQFMTSTSGDYAGAAGTLAAWGGFVVGILGLVSFGIRNLYTESIQNGIEKTEPKTEEISSLITSKLETTKKEKTKNST